MSFFSWLFHFKPLSSGDWPFVFKEAFSSFSIIPSLWRGLFNLGENILSFLWIESYFQATIRIFARFIPWVLIERLFWFWPFLALSVFSSAHLVRTLFPRYSVAWLFSCLVYVTNTYILMIVGGGQMGVAMAYSVAPLVLASFINFVRLCPSCRVHKLKTQNSKLKAAIKNAKLLRRTIILGLILALQTMFDPRIAYVTLLACGLYIIYQWYLKRFNFFLFTIHYSLFTIFIVLGLNSFWLLPMVATKAPVLEGLGGAYTTTEAVKYFSFAQFSNTISLLHPNWPENIFGKVYFMRPEFLLIPLLAYTSLLFIKPKTLFFSLLGLLGAFLAKGANPPFGGIYLWLFKYLPGMMMFRDPTKFYLLIVLSYSVLIPFSMKQINSYLKSTINNQQLTINNLLVISFAVYWLFLIRPAWSGQLSGTFKAKNVPSEYVELKDFLHNQKDFFRTFWVPKRQRFGFYSNNHPAIDALDLLKVSSASAVVDWLKNSGAKEQLSRWAVKYVIAPYDSEGEIFLKDRKYDQNERKKVEEGLKKIHWLKRLNGWDQIAIFETPEHQDHFWIETASGQGPTLTWQTINPTKYEVTVGNVNGPFTLFFSESYDKNWVARVKIKKGEEKIFSKKTNDNLNSFAISRYNGNKIVIEFKPQKYVNYGLIISGLTLLGAIGSLLWLKQKS